MKSRAAIIFLLAFCFVLQLCPNFTPLNAQFILTIEEKEMIDKARKNIKISDIGDKLENWFANLKKTNWYIRILFLGNGLDIISDMIQIKNRLIKNGELLQQQDIEKIQSALFTMDKIYPAEDELIYVIVNRLNSAKNKNWNEIIKKITNSN